MQFNYQVSYKLLSSLTAQEVLEEEEKEFSGADPLKNRMDAFQYFQERLRENIVASPAAVNVTNHSTKSITVSLHIQENEALHTVTLYESSATERDLLAPAQKELGFYKQYGIPVPDEVMNTTLLLLVPRFTTQIL